MTQRLFKSLGAVIFCTPRLHLFEYSKNSNIVKYYYTLKKCWVVLTQMWVKYGQTQWLNY